MRPGLGALKGSDASCLRGVGLGQADELNRVALMGQGVELLSERCMGWLRYNKGLDGLMGFVRPARQVRRSLYVIGFGLAVLCITHEVPSVPCV